jgi:hypothetical protein
MKRCPDRRDAVHGIRVRWGRTPQLYLVILSAIIGMLGTLGAFGQDAKARATADARGEDAMKDRIWGVMLYASDVESEIGSAIADARNPERFDVLMARIRKVCKFKNYRLLGQHNQPILKQYATWIVPSKDFFLEIDSKGEAKGGGQNLQLQLWQKELERGKKDKVLVKSDAILKEGSPIIIKGPRWRGGRLIFVLELHQQ